MDKPVIIIAEAGVNHNGNLDLAKELILAAATAGADYVKFQTFKADKLVTVDAEMASYQTKNTGNSEASQYSMLKKLEMPEEWHYELRDFSEKNNIKFLSTGFDEGSIDFLDTLGVDLYKIPSGEITNAPFLEHIASKKKPVVLSTGMSDLTEVEEALTVLIQAGISKNNITVLHCNTDYPTQMSDVNLLAMHEIKNNLGVEIGYSDHTLGIEVPIAAVALGASIIEKHFTLDRTLPGPDHLASLEPAELMAMVKAIRNIEQSISGTGQKMPSSSEIKNKSIARKSIHLNTALKQGHLLTLHDLVMKRPGDGLSPMLYKEVIGKKLKADLPADHKLSISDLV